MLDVKYILENTAEVKKRLTTRGDYSTQIDEVVNLYEQKKAAQKEADELRSNRNNLSKEIGALKSKGQNADAVMQQVAELKTRLEELERLEKELDEKVSFRLLRLPNLPLAEVPVGADDSFNKEIKKWGTPRDLGFPAKEHSELGEALGILDLERGARITGSGFVLYHGAGARLERAIISFMLDTHIADGYQEKFLPFVVNGESLLATSQLPKFKEDLYQLEGEELYLNPTAEVALVNMYRGEILNPEDLPISVTAYSPSFRKEAGSYGKDTKGIFRVHQFNKVELVKVCTPQTSEAEHQAILAQAEKVLQALELSYRIVVLSTGDMGFAAAKCYDVEVWLPGQQKYREISSASNTLDFQARRGMMRYRDPETGKPAFVHTLNASGLAVGRTMIAILENYQQADGSVLIPKVLQPYMGGMTRIEKVK